MHCVYARKLTRLSCNGHFKSVNAPLEIVHADLVGPVSPASNGGVRYFITIVDQYTGFIHTEMLREKSQAPQAIEDFRIFFEKQSGHPMKKLITDGGGEFVNQSLGEMLKAKGKQHNVAPPYTPQKNGLAERANRTIIDMMRCLLMQSNMDPEWWAEAVKMATATTNCLASLSKEKISPIELMFETKPNVNFFRPFGCKAWILKPKQNREGKFDSISWEAILIGYNNDYSSYKLI